MILQAIRHNDSGRKQRINTDMLKYLAFIEEENNNNIYTRVIKRYKNGAWVEEKQTQIVITVDKNMQRKNTDKRRLYNQLYNVTQRIKYIEDKNYQFSDGRYYIRCLRVGKPKYELLEEKMIKEG